MILLDANYLLRFLLRDEEESYNVAKECLTNNRCFVPNEVLAEVVFVLLKVYKVTKEEIKSTVVQLIQHDTILIDAKSSMIKALEIFSDRNLDFVDAILCAKSADYEIRTFDRKLLNCIENSKLEKVNPRRGKD
jgi:predicted nucleic-acid-binding protein